MATLIPQGPAFAETAPVRAEGAAVVAATPAEVWAVLLDYPAWPRWFRGVRSCRPTSDPATGVGSTREVVLVGGTRFQERFILWEEAAVWAFTATEMKPGGFRSLVERVTIEARGPSWTQVTYRMALDPSTLLRPVAPLLARAIGRNLTKAMEALGREAQDRRSQAPT